MSTTRAEQQQSEQSADGFAQICGSWVTDFGLVDGAAGTLISVDRVGRVVVSASAMAQGGASALEFSSRSDVARDATGLGSHD